ncbi:MAG: tetratricopeptide repeat protein, partial [Vulcanimicrobiaceae bacterium]
LDEARATGFEAMELNVICNLAELTSCAGHYEEALELTSGAIARARASDNTRVLATCVSNTAAYYTALGRFEQARAAAREALSLCRDLQYETPVVVTLQHFAAISAMKITGEAESVRGDRLRASRILGYVDARLRALEAQRDRGERQEYDKAWSVLCTMLSEEELETHALVGRGWNETRAIAEALLI